MIAPRARLGTHDVENQPQAAGDRDLWGEDAVLRDHAGTADTGALAAFGALLGREATREAGRAANRNPPEPVLFDRAGRRLDEVLFHPAYHDLMRIGLEAGYAARPWQAGGGGHLTHAAMVYLLGQVEPGVCCPMTMSYAAVPALAVDAGLAGLWRPKLTARAYDGSVAPLSAKSAATMGMAMTEKQGGSDLRSNATRAERTGDGWRLTGHKWFCSAPMSDGFLTLAQAPGGLTCFVVPRWLEVGTRNSIHILRLKDKLGNRANASAEIEYHGALAHRLGEEGAGVRTIIEMVHHTRLDTALAPAGLMRAALAEAARWVAHRTAFQRRLIDQPLMRALMADLALEWEGATALGLDVARAFDGEGEAPDAFARAGVAVAKYLSNKRAPWVIAEAMEVLGGQGYTEDTPLPMLFRESPLNAIWEGPGNVICLDLLRTLAKVPEAGTALAARLDAAAGADPAYDAALAAHRARWPALPEEAEARWFTESLGLLLAAAALMKRAPAPVAEAYIATRLASGGRGQSLGSIAVREGPAILARLDPTLG